MSEVPLYAGSSSGFKIGRYGCSHRRVDRGFGEGHGEEGSLKPLFLLAVQKLNTNEGFQQPKLAVFSGMPAFHSHRGVDRGLGERHGEECGALDVEDHVFELVFLRQRVPCLGPAIASGGMSKVPLHTVHP